MAWRIPLLLLLLLALPAGADELISLGVGMQKVLTVPGGIKRISVGDPAVANVKPIAPTQVVVIAGREGRTTLLVLAWRLKERPNGP